LTEDLHLITRAEDKLQSLQFWIIIYFPLMKIISLLTIGLWEKGLFL